MAGLNKVYILILAVIILQIQITNGQFLTPIYFNVAEGKDITTTATCGEGIPEQERGEMYCKLTGNTGDVLRPGETDIIHGQNCDTCNIYDPTKEHPIRFAIDGTEKWWQSPPISRGLEFNEVNITIDLGQLYHVAYVIIKSANAPRPGQWILEHSVDYGQTFEPWQYFAETRSDCYNLYSHVPYRDIRNDDDVICTDEFSDIVPLEDGEIHVSLVNGRPGASNFAYAKTLQEFTKATNIRIRLLRTNTLLGHLIGLARADPTVTRRYFYSVKDISIGGRCFCHGHASVCDTPDVNGRLQCTCEHNTCGESCDVCCPGFVQKKWQPGRPDVIYECEPCNCYGHASECYFDEQVNYERRSIDIYGVYAGGGVCQNCQHNTAGINCNHCKNGYYRPDGRQIDSPYVCERCQCDPYYSTGNCADITGECECKPEYTGPGCTQCNDGYYGFPSCRVCDCNIYGVLNKICQVSGGQCPCKPSYAGRNCDRCASGFFNFPVCEPCSCDNAGSLSAVCDPDTGECLCHDAYIGRTCSHCKRGYYGYPSCQDCYCNPIGTSAEVCDQYTGNCMCNYNFAQPRCDRCASGYYNYPVCEVCNCGHGSTPGTCYDNGQCQCLPGYAGARCDMCASGFYRYPQCIPCECNLQTGALRQSCDQYTGQCECRSNFYGRTCELCAQGFYNYPACEECNCDPAGVVSIQSRGGCGTATGGGCLCKDNVEGVTCNMCEPTYWNLQTSNPLGCEDCGCNLDGTIARISVCSEVSGQCQCKGLVTGRTCNECADGTYQLQDRNPMGCRDCGCDIGGSIDTTCNKRTGQCRCRPGVTGLNCDQPMPTRYYPSLFQYMFEVESGRTPAGDALRIGYDEFEFPEYSYLGYAVMSNIQPTVEVPITVERSDIYRIIIRYMYNGESTVRGRVTLIPSGSGSEQSSGIQFYNDYDAQLVTVEGGSTIRPFVLDPGQWTVKIQAPEGVLLDYLVLLPSAYYEASGLLKKVIEPCVSSPGDPQELCNYYVFPDINIFTTVLASDGYYDNNRVQEPIQIREGLAMLDYFQPSFSFTMPIKALARYIFIVEYTTAGGRQLQADFELRQIGRVSTGTLNLNECSYICRSVVLDASGQPMVFDVDVTDPTGKIEPVPEPFPLGISKVIAVPVDQWSIGLITPTLKCVKGADGNCVASTYPLAPGSIRIESGEGQRTRQPPDIQDPYASLMYLSIADRYPTLTVQKARPLDGNYVFIVHYYQVDATAVDVNFDVPGEYDAKGTFTGEYCPHVSGCRAVVTKDDGSTSFDLRGRSQRFTFSLPSGSNGKIWIDYILAVPLSSYTSSLLIEEPQDRARDFITKCGQKDFYVDPETVSEFCQKNVYSLSVEYNDGAQPCQCDPQGSIGQQCEPFGGQCQCRTNIVGRDCTKCKIGFFNFPRCSPCSCSSGACDARGQCVCPPNVVGASCNRCAPNTYGYNPLVGCAACECDPRGVDRRDMSCDSTTGQCSCIASIGGRRCDQCAAGYQGNFPSCQRCDCDSSGTTSDICDQSSRQCICKENVLGVRCDQCRAGSYYLNPDSEKGCIDCFCFGITTSCKKYNRRRSKINTMDDFDVTNVADPYLQSFSNTVNLYVQGSGDNPQSAIYWVLPAQYNGNKLTSYGGKLEYTVINNPLRRQPGQPIRQPDIIISGNNITIVYTHNVQPMLGDRLTVSVDLIESNFQYSFSARQVMRDDFMMVISNINTFHIRAQYVDALLDASIKDVSMEVAGRVGSGPRAFAVERCSCPPQYKGLSCEQCVEGYYRGGPGPYLGRCIPCNCNNHADRCDPVTGQCVDCRDGTTGLHCHECDVGYFGDATRGTMGDCKLCACPFPENGRNFATTCSISSFGELTCTCLPGHVGEKCDRCAYGFFGDPRQPGGYCRRCECNFNSGPSAPDAECDPLTGSCMNCAPGTTGANCEMCADWMWGDAVIHKNCQACTCDQCGSSYCEKSDGSCECKDGVVGSRCDRCAPLYYGFSSCQECTPCDCSFAAYSPQCDLDSGQCSCKPGVDGLRCEKCAVGFWNWTPNGCERCPCPTYQRCELGTGRCVCPPGASGPRCDQCADRYVLTEDGCEACDWCVHRLLDKSDYIKELIEGTIINITDTITGARAYGRLIRLEKAVQALQPPLKNMIDNNIVVGRGISDMEYSLGGLIRLGNYVEAKSRRTSTSAGYTSQGAERTKVRAEDLLNRLNGTFWGVQDAVEAVANISALAGDITPEESNRLIEEARRIVAEIARRDFYWPEWFADRELILAKDVLERAKGLRNNSVDLAEKAMNMSRDVEDFTDRLNDLINQTAMANRTTNETNEILNRHKPPKFQVIMDLVRGNYSAAGDEIDNATRLLEEAQAALDAANAALQGVRTNASKLEDALNKLKPEIPMIYEQLRNMTPLVDMAKEYAANLTKQADYLDSLLRDTRELAANALKAANAYKSIADAIAEAEKAAKAALKASKGAEEGANSFGNRPAESLKRSKRLNRKAIKALDGVKDLEDKLGGVKDAIGKVKDTLDTAAETLAGIQDGINDIPDDSSKCTIVVCDENARQCQPGFTGQECSSAQLGPKAQAAAMVAMDADRSAQRAQDIADWVMANLPSLQNKMDQIPIDNSEYDKALNVAEDGIKRARGHIQEFRDRDKALTDKHNQLKNMTYTINYDLYLLKRLVNEARTAAAGVKVAMKFVTDSSLQLRRPANYQEPSSRNVIELYFNTRMNNALLYFAGGPTPTDDYMAIEIKDSKPVLRYNLAGEEGVTTVEEVVSDGAWHRIIIERTAAYGKIFLFSEGRPMAQAANAVSTGSTLTFSPDAAFYLGGVPPSVNLPPTITSYSFQGCIDELVSDDQAIGLWNFHEGINVNHGCLRNVSTLGIPPEEGVYFNGNGYTIMSDPGGASGGSFVQLEFKTFSQNGVLYFSPGTNGRDYLALEMRGGKLYYHWNLGIGAGVLESTGLYNDGEWTGVKITRAGEIGTLTISRGSVPVESVLRGSSPLGMETLDRLSNSQFYGGITGIPLGNFPDVRRVGFRGCIRNVQFAGSPVDITKNLATGGTTPKCVPTAITAVAFVGGGGYISWTPVDVNNRQDIVFQFRTEQPEGMILYIANQAGSNYLSAVIVDGGIHVVADSGSDSGSDRVELRSNNNNYNDGELHTVVIDKNNKRLSLTVDDVDTAESRFQKSRLRTDGVLYIGSLPDYALSTIQAGVLPTTSPFIGCIISLSFNGNLLSMISNLRDESNAITNNCPVGGAVNMTTISPYPLPTGPTSPIIRPGTTPAPMGQCALPKDPSQSPIDPADVDAFQFGITSSSRYEYPALPVRDFAKSGTISMDVRTSALDGLLMYVADRRKTDKVFAYLQDGYVGFGFDYGSGPVFLTSNIEINDGQWHTLDLVRISKTGIIRVDGVVVAKAELGGSNSRLKTTSPLYVGGVPSDYTPKGIPDGSRFSLVGCMKNVVLNRELQGPPSAQYDAQPCSGIKEPGVFIGPNRGHVILEPNYYIGEEREVRLSVKPRSSSGVIFSVTDTSSQDGDFLSLEMVNGVLYLRTDNSAGTVEATYSPPEGAFFMCDGNWHDIVAIKNGHTLQLIVDGDEGAIAAGSVRARSADTSHPLYLGGLPVGVSHRGIQTNEDFAGCIRDVMVGENLVDFKLVHSSAGDVDLIACPSN